MSGIHHYGNWYQHTIGEVYVLAEAGYYKENCEPTGNHHAMLISLKDGCFWNDPVIVEGNNYVSSYEFNLISSGCENQFTKINNPYK